MAYNDFQAYGSAGGNANSQEGHGLDAHSQTLHFSADGVESINLPDVAFIKDADLSRDGTDLVLDGGDHGTVVIEGYFAQADAPDITCGTGETLTPELVDAFAHGPMQFADAGSSMTDASPIGAVDEVTGDATILRTDGTSETVTMGTPVYQGDVIETSADGAVNIVFIDETNFAVSQDARLAIDEYVFDPATQSGTSNFSVLKGMFVFTSGLIGRDDPDDVEIDTPVGSIGIRGTIIAGDVDSGEITVVEGAIVLRDFKGNEMTLSNQYETARFNVGNGSIDSMGLLEAHDLAGRFESISDVSGGLFSSITDSINDSDNSGTQETGSGEGENRTGETTDPAAEANTIEVAPEDAPADQAVKPQARPKGPFEAQDGDMPGPLEFHPVQEVVNYEGDLTVIQMEDLLIAQKLAGYNPIQQLVFKSLDPYLATFVAPPPDVAAPIVRKHLPGDYFHAVEGQSWTYNFGQDFSDSDSFFISSYTLSDATQDILNNLTTNGILQSGYSFNTSNGSLTLTPVTDFTGNIPITLQVQAIDPNGNIAPFVNYSFVLHGDTQSLVAGTSNILADNKTFINPANLSVVTIGDDTSTDAAVGNFVFMGANNNLVEVDHGINNKIYMDGSMNTVKFYAQSVDNEAFGGIGTDTFYMYNVNNRAYGQAGQDTFVLDMNTISPLYTAGHANIRMDGGTGGSLDTLKTINTGVLNFTQIDNAYIKNIEIIDLSSSSVDVKLNYGDVIAMTESNNRLIIKGESDDSVTFDTQGHGFTNTSSQTIGADTYNVYTDSHGVSLYIDQDISDVNFA